MSKPNFRTIENYEPQVDYEEFKEDYLNSKLNYTEIRKKYDLSKKRYSRLAERVRLEEGLECRPRHIKARNFYDMGSRWQVIKTIDKKRMVMGSLPKSYFSKEDMVKVVEKCEKLGWKYTSCERYLRRLNKQCHL